MEIITGIKPSDMLNAEEVFLYEPSLYLCLFVGSIYKTNRVCVLFTNEYVSLHGRRNEQGERFLRC